MVVRHQRLGRFRVPARNEARRRPPAGLLAYSLAFGIRIAVILALPLAAMAGPYAPPPDQPASTAIPASDSSFMGWATGASVARGPMNIANPQLGAASYGTATNAVGPAEGAFNTVVSLGDGGSATLTFDRPITDRAGFDFAVFENGFADNYLELAFVEVSSNGTNYFRFNAVSLTQTDTQVGSFGTLDPTDLHNLAGKYRGGFGTPFDLSELAGISPLLDITSVTHVRIVDVIGSLDDAYATFDSLGHKVNDPWPTGSSGGGFDLDGVGVIHAVPEPTALALLAVSAVLLSARRNRRKM